MHPVKQQYLNAEHESIFETTKHIPGWQEPGDSFKLFEMAYEAGDVILEIGTYGGRSAVVELRGALANPERTITPPQFFGVEIDIHGIWRSYNSLKEAGLEQYAILFHGDLTEFLNTCSIKPTMVFVDGDHRYEGVKRDLELLAEALSPGTPVLCHDYLNPDNDTGILGVRRAVTDFVEAGYATLEGTFGCSAFLIMTDACQGMAQTRFTPLEFLEHKIRLLESQGKQLYQSWQNSEGDRKARLDVILALQQQLNTHGIPVNTVEKVPLRLQQGIQDKQAKIKKLRAKVASLTADLEHSNAEIEAMKTSKFWKVRSLWMQVKQFLGGSK